MKHKKLFALLALSFLLYSTIFSGRQSLNAAEQGTTIIKEETVIWNERYNTKGLVLGSKPLKFLKENIDILPKGRAFVLAMGEGMDAVFLAKNGYVVEGCDISEVAIEKAKKLAKKKGVEIGAFVADLTKYKIKENHYDLITCFYYLQRDMIQQIKDGLRKGGMVIFETYTIDQLDLGPDVMGPKNKEYLLKHNELLDFFQDLRVLNYQELVVDNRKAIARIIAGKISD